MLSIQKRDEGEPFAICLIIGCCDKIIYHYIIPEHQIGQARLHREWWNVLSIGDRPIRASKLAWGICHPNFKRSQTNIAPQACRRGACLRLPQNHRIHKFMSTSKGKVTGFSNITKKDTVTRVEYNRSAACPGKLEQGGSQHVYHEDKMPVRAPSLCSARHQRSSRAPFLRQSRDGWGTRQEPPSCEKHLGDREAAVGQPVGLRVIHSNTFVPAATACRRTPEPRRHLVSLDALLSPRRSPLRSDRGNGMVGGQSGPGGG